MDFQVSPLSALTIVVIALANACNNSALKFRAWLTPESECACKAGKKCTCKVRVLIFDTGQVVIIGARTIADINQVYYRLKTLVNANFRDETDALPKSERFTTRMARLLCDDGFGVVKGNPSDSDPSIPGASYSGLLNVAGGEHSRMPAAVTETTTAAAVHVPVTEQEEVDHDLELLADMFEEAAFRE